MIVEISVTKDKLKEFCESNNMYMPTILVELDKQTIVVASEGLISCLEDSNLTWWFK